MYICILFQNLCKELHSKIDLADEERYDCEHKVIKHNKDVSDSQQMNDVSSVNHKFPLVQNR